MARSIRFQFRPEAKVGLRDSVVKRLMDGGARAVEALFPGETDAELARLFTVRVEDERAIPALLSLLASDAAVAFAEEDAPRRLVRPPRSGPRRRPK